MVKGTWAKGHYARKHNPSKLPEVKLKQSASAKRRAESGELKSIGFTGWQTGLTKETDERIAALGRKSSQTILSDPERIRKRSENCKKQWEEGRITPNPKGPGSSRWKGGISPLQPWCRAALYQKWSRPIMVRDGFTCQHCQAHRGGDLCVHHDKERFAEILHRIVADRQVPQLSYEEKISIVDEVVQYHLDNEVSGITLCVACHNKLHEIDADLD